MSKLINTDDLDKVVCRLNEAMWGITREDYKLFVDVLAEFPTIEDRKTEWIPVSERLPDKGGSYLVTLRNGDVELRYYLSTLDKFVLQMDVIAWMPVPKPYKVCTYKETGCGDCRWYLECPYDEADKEGVKT